jgi:hypothetical protein
MIAARITRSGRSREEGYSEPYALLAGRRFPEPMGWNRTGRIYKAGELGIVDYFGMGGASLYRFTAVDEAADPQLCEIIRQAHGSAAMDVRIEFPERQGARAFRSLHAAAAHAIELLLAEEAAA